MDSQQAFWEKLKDKYEAKNRILQQREQELKLKLEAMHTILGNCNHNNKPNDVVPTTDKTPTTSSIPASNNAVPTTILPVTNKVQNTSKLNTN
ncbi:hypothetical protein Zmor_006704 [Zophobas morio]|uniref:Uncharacterized protein n=1 Tax=Zophobas morio TaxID=2755281 RepID=A0AA38IUC7_9CUCU|nr:hypothetical protein Zmor_006704 [Zophobas morio]